MSARSLRTRRVGAASDNSTELSNARPLSSSSKRQRSPSDDSTQHLKKCKASRSSPKLELSCGVRFKPDQKLPDNHLQNLRFRPRCLLLNAILSDNEGALVLLITMKAGPHILKLVRSVLLVRNYTDEALGFTCVVRDYCSVVC